jgi:hypothetical protein
MQIAAISQPSGSFVGYIFHESGKIKPNIGEMASKPNIGLAKTLTSR